MSFDDRKLTININGKPGIIGLANEKINCFTCSKNDCRHTNYFKGNDLHPLALEIVAQIESKKGYERECFSKKYIPFIPDKKDTFKLQEPLEKYVHTQNGNILLLADFDKVVCQHCGSALVQSEGARQIEVFTRTKI